MWGLTFSGGSWSNITSLQIARSLKYPDTKVKGNGNYKFALYTSKHCHYSVEKGAILLGLGSENVFKVDVDENGVMDVDSLKQVIEKPRKKAIPHYILMPLPVLLCLGPMIHSWKLVKLLKNTISISTLMDPGVEMLFFHQNIEID